MYKLAVIGNPVAHSLSPAIFEAFAKEFAIELTYTRILAENTLEFAAKVNEFFLHGGTALNVTSPFKQNAYTLAPEHTIRSGFCQAGSFMYTTSTGNLCADTFDGLGLVTDLVVLKQVSLTNKNILILGSGYVLDSILLDLIVKNPARVDILARNLSRVDYLHNKFAVGRHDRKQAYDLIINTIPNTVDNVLLERITQKDSLVYCYDLNYVPDSVFLRYMQAVQHDNVVCYNGIGMLIEHNKAAFSRIFKYTPDTQRVYATLTGIPLVV